jgi:hypothetical protein
MSWSHSYSAHQYLSKADLSQFLQFPPLDSPLDSPRRLDAVWSCYARVIDDRSADFQGVLLLFTRLQ